MAKQKKISSEATEELYSSKNSSLGYQGRVQVQIACGDRILSTKKYHNEGLPDLFRYISYALVGAYYPTLRPCKVALYNYANSDNRTNGPNTFNWATAITSNIFTPVSPYVTYDATPVVLSTENGYAATYRFKIPFNWLYRPAFNTLVLLSENNTALAYYLCVKQENGEQVWDPEELSDVNGNYTIIVEWTMEVSNKA
jgi:hypothetical protein